jgi:glycosyltransferase involved in cell wall biosynthesis
VARISVVICSHNPRPIYLHRVVDALQAQSLQLIYWELLLIDNASAERLADHWDISWHTDARHVHEDELGLVAARLRGITESRGDVIIFVDDDNLLDPDYLAKAFSGRGVGPSDRSSRRGPKSGPENTGVIWQFVTMLVPIGQTIRGIGIVCRVAQGSAFAEKLPSNTEIRWSKAGCDVLLPAKARVFLHAKIPT